MFGITLTSERRLRIRLLYLGVNYFLKDKEGNYLNDPKDKHVWVKWMELRVHNEVDAIKIPTGYIPKYEDLRKLFKQVREKDYSKKRVYQNSLASEFKKTCLRLSG